MSEPNVLFPALPDYAGPTAGLFGFLHHDRPWEWSHDVTERVAYCRANKPATELATRERHMVHLSQERLLAIGVPVPTLAEGARLRAESARLWAEGYRLWAEGYRLWAESYRLRAEGNRLRDEGARLWAEGARLLEPYADAITALAVSLVPDCRWDGSEIVFS